MTFKIGERFGKLFAAIRAKLFEIEIDYINGPETLPPPLSAEKELDYLKKLEQGDKDAREELIVHNLRLVVYIAKKFENTGIPIEDLQNFQKYQACHLRFEVH